MLRARYMSLQLVSYSPTLQISTDDTWNVLQVEKIPLLAVSALHQLERWSSSLRSARRTVQTSFSIKCL